MNQCDRRPATGVSALRRPCSDERDIDRPLHIQIHGAQDIDRELSNRHLLEVGDQLSCAFRRQPAPFEAGGGGVADLLPQGRGRAHDVSYRDVSPRSVSQRRRGAQPDVAQISCCRYQHDSVSRPSLAVQQIVQ